MRAVRVHVTDAELADRRLKGLDRWDEMWDGVLHMVPAPSLEHQRLLDRLIGFLEPHLRTSGRGRLISGINVFADAGNYRIPDLTFVATGREFILQEDGVRGGAPDAVIEIRSADDETYEKLPFYASLGITDVIVIDRGSKRPELYRLAGSQYILVQSDTNRWLRSDVMGVRFSAVEQPAARLIVEDVVDAGIHVEI
jgi:Uma2 family endonuclease